MNKKLLIATGNKEKVKEVEDILEIPLEFVDIDIDEVQSMDLEYVANKKANEAFKILKRPVMVDDVGVFIDAWNGFPGPFAKFLLSAYGNKKLLKLLEDEKNRKVIVRSVVAYHDGKKVYTFLGEVEGSLAYEEKGIDGWGFDPIIIPKGGTLTYAQMGSKKKNQLSHRRRAIDKLKIFLDSQKT